MTSTARNWTYLTVSGIVRLYMLGALAISFRHIITASAMLGLHGWQAYTVPFTIDGFAVLGMIGRSAQFAASTQRTGLRLQAAAGLVSLACNVYAGHTVGERIYGALIVSAFLVAEWYAAKLRPAPSKAPEIAQAERRRTAAIKGAATRKANAEKALSPQQKAARTRAARKAERELAAMAGGYVPADAPVSPALV